MIPSRPGMTHYLLKRGSKFLQQNYYWGSFPHAFSELELQVVLPEAMNYRDCPEMVGELHDGVLDNAIWQRLDRCGAMNIIRL